ncbi:MAG: hypothetical protein V3U19_04805, partial [Thermodesulfobacteriota bacterium]
MDKSCGLLFKTLVVISPLLLLLIIATAPIVSAVSSTETADGGAATTISPTFEDRGSYINTISNDNSYFS